MKNNIFNLMSIRDFAKEIGKPESTIRTWRNRKSIPDDVFVLIGKTVFIKVNKFQEWLENN